MKNSKKLFSENINEDNEDNKNTEKDKFEEFSKMINNDEVDDTNYESFRKFEVDSSWLNKYDDFRETHESYEIKVLREDLYDTFTKSFFYEKYKNLRKVQKQDVLDIFLHFYDNIPEGERYTLTEKFLEIANFMNINFDILYKELPMIYKQRLISEMNQKYKIFSNRKVNKLF